MNDNNYKPKDMKAQRIVESLKVVQNQRLQHDYAVKECAHFIIPRKSDMRSIDSLGSVPSELKAYANLFTRAGRSACQKLASGMFSYLTPKNQKWFRPTTGDIDVDSDNEVYAWYDKVRDIMLYELAKSNFTEISHETYLNLGAIGTVCTELEWDKEIKELVFTDNPYSTFFFTEDKHKRPNRVYREYTYTAEQAIEEWGEEALSGCKSIMNSYNSKDEAERRENHRFIHLVEPNRARDKTKIDKLNKKFSSIYVAVADLQIIKVGGFDDLPYIVARFFKYNSEGNVMGYSPAMDCMPIIKTLENLKKKFLLAVEKNLNPAMSRGVTMGMVPNKVRTTPNSISNFDSRNPESKPTPILQQIDLSYTLQELESQVLEIEDAFFIPSFQTITNINKSNATATEILAREREALIQVSPAISRTENEWLDKLLKKVFTILQKLGKFPEPPEKLGGRDFDIEFTGVLSSASKLIDAMAIVSHFQELNSIMEMMPEDKRMEIQNSYDYYEVTKALQEARNLPVRFRRNKAEIEEEAKAKQEAMQQQQKEMQMADIAKSQNLNESPQDGSVMKEVM